MRAIAVEHWSDLQPFAPPRTRARIALVGVAAFIGSLAEAPSRVLTPWTAAPPTRAVERVAVAGQELERTQAVVVALVFVAIRIAMTLVSTTASSRFCAAVMERAQRRLLDAYLATSHAARSSRPPGDLAALSSNHGRFTGELANAFTIVATNATGVLAFGTMSLAVNPFATIGIAAIGALLLLFMRPLRSRSKAAADSFSEGARRSGHDLTEIENLHREIEVFQVKEQVVRRVDVDVQQGASRFQRLRFLTEAIPQLFQAILLGAAVLSLLFIINGSGDADLAGVGAVVLLLIRSMSSAQGTVTGNQKVIEFGAYARALRQLVGEFEVNSQHFGEERPASLAPLALRDVRFSYDGSTEVLRQVTATIDRGELVGLVGPSGSGKSTLVELVLRLRSPTSGTISYGGVPIEAIDPAELSRRVAFVPQHPVLVRGTVAENVDLFRELPEDRIRAALKQAHLADEIDALPDGIHTRLGPDDRALSGGQRQRLTIARALAGAPEILVLDEPTSALDAVSENAIRRALAELPSGRIVVVVAHRYSTLRSCSRILVLRDGTIEVDATPEEVAARSEFFQSMVGSET